MTHSLVTMLEPDIASRLGVLDIEIIVPTTTIFKILLLLRHSHTQNLIIATDLKENVQPCFALLSFHLFIVQTKSVVFSDAIVALMLVRWSGGRVGDGGGDSVIRT